MNKILIYSLLLLIGLEINAQSKFDIAPKIFFGLVNTRADTYVNGNHYNKSSFESVATLSPQIAISIDYNINDAFFSGIEPAYEFHSQSFEGYYFFTNFLFENYDRHEIKSHEVRLPISAGLHLNNHFIKFKYGLSTYLRSKYIIEEQRIYYSSTDIDEELIFINEDKIQLFNGKNKIGHFLEIGFGRNFNIFDSDFLCELFYYHNLNSWKYNPNEQEYFDNTFYLKNHSFYLKLGYKPQTS